MNFKNTSIADRLTKREAQDLATCSIGRVISTTMRILEKSRHPDAIMNLEDWESIKGTAEKVWNDARNEAFIKQYNDNKERGK